MIEVYTMHLGRLAAALMTPTPHSNWSAVPAGVTGGPVQQITYVLSADHIHVPCTLLFAHLAHSSREDIHVHVQSEGEEAGGVVADHSKGQDTRQSIIAVHIEVDEDAITVSWQFPRHNDVDGAHILHRQSHPVLGEGGGRG